MKPILSSFAGEKIVIADDEEVVVTLTRMLLERRGFMVKTAVNGRQCVDLVGEYRPALVLMDYMMPVMNGYEALKQIRSNYPETYVLMFTGVGNEEVAVQLMKAGASDYLQKPFVNQSLLERIDSVLNVRKVEMENERLLQAQEALQREVRAWNNELEQRVVEKTRALEDAHREIVQAKKLTLFGHISAGLAHEIRNPLNSINLYSEILQSEEGMTEEQLDYLRKISQEVLRIDKILVRMLDVSHSSNHAWSQVCLENTVQNILQTEADHLLVQKIDVRFHVDKDLPTLYADPLEIEQVFSNLVVNSLQEMPEGGELNISLKADMEKFSIEVADTGPGIADENLDQVFDPFFTTRKKGTGFGLSVVERIVKSYGGTVRAESPEAGGALITIQLPLLQGAVH
jgi:signal transduction histidine kinase